MCCLRGSKYIIVFLCLYVITNLAQSETNVVILDTLNSSAKSEFQLKLNNNSQLHSPLFIIKQPMIFDEYSMLILPTIEQSTTNENISMMQLRNEINQSMSIYRQGQNKYQLGLVGDILGYVSTAAAAGLAVYHVHKFKKQYGLK